MVASLFVCCLSHLLAERFQQKIGQSLQQLFVCMLGWLMFALALEPERELPS
jgi:hypothetical protein